MVIETRERSAQREEAEEPGLKQERLAALRAQYELDHSKRPGLREHLTERWVVLPRAAQINALILGALVLAMFAETLEYMDLTVPLFYLPLLLAFASFARRLTQDPGAVRALRVSAVACVLLGALGVWGFETSVTSTPTDYVCMAMSLPLTALFGYGAWWQHRESKK